MTPDRRRLLATLLGGSAVGALVVPEKWARPVVKTLVVPAHANASPAATTTVTFSDIRLKRDIVRVGHLDNGLALYRYRYLWSDQLFVGVMAQEVAPMRPDAVVTGDDGFMRVDYARLGGRLMRWDEWENQPGGHAAAARNASPAQVALH
jgi:hypothetical protein